MRKIFEFWVFQIIISFGLSAAIVLGLMFTFLSIDDIYTRQKAECLKYQGTWIDSINGEYCKNPKEFKIKS